MDDLSCLDPKVTGTLLYYPKIMELDCIFKYMYNRIPVCSTDPRMNKFNENKIVYT
jgi:hypothetical protein